jgi:hypothetical protein
MGTVKMRVITGISTVEIHCFLINFKSFEPTTNFMETNPKQCLHCTKKIAGRTDKKFCNNQCRSSYHNHFYGDRSNYMRRVNGLLLRNRKILADLFALHRTGAAVPLSELYLKGFSPSHFTHQQKKARNQLLTYCYEFGYQITEKNCIKIIQQTNIE